VNQRIWILVLPLLFSYAAHAQDDLYMPKMPVEEKIEMQRFKTQLGRDLPDLIRRSQSREVDLWIILDERFHLFEIALDEGGFDGREIKVFERAFARAIAEIIVEGSNLPEATREIIYSRARSMIELYDLFHKAEYFKDNRNLSAEQKKTIREAYEKGVSEIGSKEVAGRDIMKKMARRAAGREGTPSGKEPTMSKELSKAIREAAVRAAEAAKNVGRRIK